MGRIRQCLFRYSHQTHEWRNYELKTPLPALLLIAGLIGLGTAKSFAALAVPAPSEAEIAEAAKDESRHFGDAPDINPPLATDLSPELTPDAVVKAMRKVADWQLARAEP